MQKYFAEKRFLHCVVIFLEENQRICVLCIPLKNNNKGKVFNFSNDEHFMKTSFLFITPSYLMMTIHLLFLSITRFSYYFDVFIKHNRQFLTISENLNFIVCHIKFKKALSCIHIATKCCHISNVKAELKNWKLMRNQIKISKINSDKVNGESH